MVQPPLFGGVLVLSVCGGEYELGLGALRCVYENAMFDEGWLFGDLGTGWGADTAEDAVASCRLELAAHPCEMVDVRGSSESDPLSHASSSAQSFEL